MARKAKESAQQKISSWTNSSRRSAAASKPPTTTTTTSAIAKKNANTSDENRKPLQTQSRSTINSLKNCSVTLMRLPDDTIEVQPKEPTIIAKEPDAAPKSANQNVYDYSFDLDATPLENSEPMQELFEKLAAENRIEIKKYKPKAVRQVKKKADDADRPKAARKRRQDKPKPTSEPPLKKPNPTVGGQIDDNQAIQTKPVQIDSNSNNILHNVAAQMDSNANMPSPIARTTQSNTSLRTNQIGNIQQRLRHSLSLRPTLGSSTPLNSAKTLGMRMRNNENNTPKNLSWLGVSSVGKPITPMGSKSTPIAKPTAALSFVEENRDTNQENDENTNHSVFAVDDFDAMDFIDPEPIPSTSAAAMEKPMSVNSSLSVSNRENQSTMLNDSSSFNIFSPTKRRVYGRSPLKNITNEVNNTGNSTFESLKSLPSFAPSFGSVSRDSRNASTNRSGSILPDANNLPIRRTVTDFDRRRTSVAAQSIDKCFGFEDDDDNDDGENETTPKTLVVTSALNRARADLKRFLHGSDTRSETLAKKPMAKEESRNKPNLFKSPTKEKATTAFDAPDKNKQKDIRRAFEAKTAKNVDSAGASTKRVVLFEDDQIVQDRRKSYSRPVRQIRKRRISIDSEDEYDKDDNDKESDEEEGGQNENGGKKARSKRRKKNEMNPKETKELAEFVQQTNAHFDEIDSFTMILE